MLKSSRPRKYYEARVLQDEGVREEESEWRVLVDENDEELRDNNLARLRKEVKDYLISTDDPAVVVIAEVTVRYLPLLKPREVPMRPFRIKQLMKVMAEESIDLVQLTEIQDAFRLIPDSFLTDLRENATPSDMLNVLMDYCKFRRLCKQE